MTQTQCPMKKVARLKQGNEHVRDKKALTLQSTQSRHYLNQLFTDGEEDGLLLTCRKSIGTIGLKKKSQ